MEEKGSDVNLAAYLLNDAWMNLFEAAVVVSNDTDGDVEGYRHERGILAEALLG